MNQKKIIKSHKKTIAKINDMVYYTNMKAVSKKETKTVRKMTVEEKIRSVFSESEALEENSIGIFLENREFRGN